MSSAEQEKPFLLRTPEELRYMRDHVSTKSLQGYRSHIIQKQPDSYAEQLNLLDNILEKIKPCTVNGELETLSDESFERLKEGAEDIISKLDEQPKPKPKPKKKKKAKKK
jgi:hypothetical protein